MRVLGYLDAASGSLVVSAIVAGFAAVGVFFRMGARRAKMLFSSKARAENRAQKEAAEAMAMAVADADGPDALAEAGTSTTA
jgi:hypothetical protein